MTKRRNLVNDQRVTDYTRLITTMISDCAEHCQLDDYKALLKKLSADLKLRMSVSGMRKVKSGKRFTAEIDSLTSGLNRAMKSKPKQTARRKRASRAWESYGYV